MTDRKALHRKRKKSGYMCLKDWFVLSKDLPEIEPYLRTAEQVDAAIDAAPHPTVTQGDR